MGWRRRAAASVSCWALLAVVAPAAAAFHAGGVGYCDGCHDLHSGEGQPEGLLRGSDISSTCLRCHAEAGEAHNILSDDGSSFTPGGDFYWLKRSFSWTAEGRDEASPGESHGHNVVALDYGLLPDTRGASGSASGFLGTELTCASCHDPHGERGGDGDGGVPISGSGSFGDAPVEGGALGNYRLLGGEGYAPPGATFSHAAPVAVAPLDWEETDASHVDYGSGMSEWCTNCHPGMHGGAEAQHPSGASARFSGQTARAYASYVRTGDFTGSLDSSYWALVPFERGVSEPDLLDPASRTGPDSGSNVMCLTCHRAHASAFRNIGRWDFSATLLAESHPRAGDEGTSPWDARNSYYGRDIEAELGPYQRSLCNKCHVRD